MILLAPSSFFSFSPAVGPLCKDTHCDALTSLMYCAEDNFRFADRLSKVTPSVFGHRTTTKDIVKEFDTHHNKMLEKLKREPVLMLPQWTQKRRFPRADSSPERDRSPSPMFMSPINKGHSRNISFSSKSSRSPSPIGFLPVMSEDGAD